MVALAVWWIRSHQVRRCHWMISSSFERWNNLEVERIGFQNRWR